MGVVCCQPGEQYACICTFGRRSRPQYTLLCLLAAPCAAPDILWAAHMAANVQS